MIWEELKDSLIFTGLQAETSDDVMRQLGAAFINEGYCKETYEEALIAREKEFPTGLDVDGIGVAIPHTDVSHVNEPGIAIAVLTDPVTFIQMGTDDEITQVKLVFMLAVKDPNAHLENLQQIIAIIQDTEVLKKLLEVTEKKEIIEIIKEKENSL